MSAVYIVKKLRVRKSDTFTLIQVKTVLNGILKSESDFEDGWIPLSSYSINADPAGIMIEKAKTEPVAIEIALLLIDHCFAKAKRLKDTSYILFFFDCLDNLSIGHVDVGLRTTRDFAYLSCRDRKFIIDNHRISHLPTFSQLWSHENRKIYQCRNPIPQFHRSTEEPDPLNANFAEDVFIAHMNLLWTSVPSTRDPHVKHLCDASQSATTWLQIFYHSIQFSINPVSHVYVRSQYYSLEILDNPAMEAIIQFKWNTFVFGIWLIRFANQCVYYSLILIASLMQIYYENKDYLLGVFATIICLSYVFLWLEILQWRESQYHAKSGNGSEDLIKDSTSGNNSKQLESDDKTHDTRSQRMMHSLQLNHFERLVQWEFRPIRWTAKEQETDSKSFQNSQRRTSPYFGLPYNVLDLAMYLYPLEISVHQVIYILRQERDGITADFSFSTLAELRVTETVCKYITIVFGILQEIRVFFLVYAASALFFSVAIIHVLYGVGSNAGEPQNVYLPDNFFGAITTVYLMVGGRYDPLADDLFINGDGETVTAYKNWPLQIMVMIYFTVALINVAFFKADDSWRQVCLENRLRFVESAENMSYHIPGRRSITQWHYTKRNRIGDESRGEMKKSFFDNYEEEQVFGSTNGHEEE
ncbi:hypothetical protein BGW38_005258 [Lunasporangiospora selenospora]|uniref:Ion transport domain-containing protein n=1 Tax=Lunasporangiospora selenospora TaxID=979761 RepID=A0A9P6KGJ8_9FUNG|nr:hypothetical protein BGW38_005258 [Lunasporangiospora selenospora]